MRDFVADVLHWIDDRPAWIRPALYGALLVPAWAVRKGALIIIPIAGVVVLLTHEHPFQAIGRGLLIFTLAVGGAALSGLAYSLLGRRVRDARLIGPYLAGWLSCWPYVFVLLVIMRLYEGTPVTTSFEDSEWFVLGFGTFYVGAMVGFFLFRDA
jgi:hypothetical protein